MKHNFLRDSKSISNSTLCRYDSMSGYSTDFSKNGDVNGWDIYNNIYMYGCWNNLIFGSSHLDECYIGRTTVFLSVNAEEYFFIEFILKVVDENPNKVVKGLNKGKIMWSRTDDNDWSEERTIEFNITGVGTWEYYKLNLGPYKWWQGDINNLRFYPFIDGNKKDKFFLKYLRITSEDFWMCTNTNCSFYQLYNHPCCGAGSRPYCEATVKKKNYSFVQGVSSELLIDIDSYGIEPIELGNNLLVSGNDVAKIIGNNISTINIGGYSFAEINYTDENVIRIYSGTNGSNSSIVIHYSKAAEELGFFSVNKEAIYTYVSGTIQASGFDYASTKLLQTFEINSLINGSNDVAYVHNPSQYSVEGGRRDFNEIGTSKLISSIEDVTIFVSFDNTGKTIVDLSKRIDNNGKLTHFWVYGVLNPGASLKILRPHNDGSFSVIHTILLPTKEANTLYTSKPLVSQVTCDVLVTKGDLLGIYNANLYVGQTATKLPDATFIQFSGDIYGRVYESVSHSYGVGGFAMYARGDLKQTNTILDIDLGNRLNISEFVVSGEELENYYEFNIASCLDITWEVDLFNETHNHSGYYAITLDRWYDTHNNIYYGKECLDDLIITADNGKQGDVYSQNNGLATQGHHAYFYVNGDFEWPYSTVCTGLTEYCGNKVPTSGVLNYISDPIAFTLLFPEEYEYDIHKSIMYFKEEKNFRNIALSTYGGFYNYLGNADSIEYNLIPNYKYIYLNGVKYSPEDSDNIKRYLFKNPAVSTIYAQDYDDLEKTADHIATYFVYWSILGHEFDPISCKGFRIYCDSHYSTKITEIEVYSKIKSDTSMVDNTVLHFSDYGDKWRSAGFKKIDDKTTSAFIGGTPGYFRVTLESHTTFNMREIYVTTTEQTYLENSTVLLTDTKNGEIGESTAVEIKNTYNKAFDLSIDIPRDLVSNKNIVFWNKLNSSSDLENSELGPSCLLYKNKDHIITYIEGQCANNCYTYGLVNLVNNKDAYYSLNTFDWNYFGTVSSGVALSFSNKAYLHRYKFYSSLSPVSSKYWRLQIVSSDRVIVVNDIIATYLDTRVKIDRILLSETIPSNYLNYIDNDGSNIPSYYTFKDSFIDGTWYEFSVSGSSSPESYVVNNEYLYINSKGGTSNLSTYSFSNSNNFEFTIKYYFTVATTTIYANTSCNFEFYNAADKLFSISWTVTANVDTSSCASTLHKLSIFVLTSNVYNNTTLGCYLNVNTLNTIVLRKAGTKVSLYLGENVFITTFDLGYDYNITSFYYRTTSSVTTSRVYHVSFKYRVLLFGEYWVGIRLHNNDPIDRINLISTGNALTMKVLTSNDNSLYSIWEVVSLIREDLHIYFSVDLEKRHSLAIIRNYGSGNLFYVALTLNTVFSNTSGDIYNAEFNSTSSDCRWVGVKINCSDNILKSIEKLGIYTDITIPFCKDGGLNNTWISLPNTLTSYMPIKNVALNATVSGTSFYKDHIPERSVNGESSKFGPEFCWAYKKDTNPVLYIEFGGEFNVGHFIMHNGYSSDINSGYNKSYKLSLDNTSSGDSRTWVLVYTASNITDSSTRKHSFDYVHARRAKLEITSFDYIEVIEDISDSTYLVVYIGFLREIEILAKENTTIISSEDYPIVCVDLRSSFNVVDVKLYNPFQQDDSLITDSSNNMWDNSSEFISYSDNITSDPTKATFSRGQDYTTEYENNLNTGDLKYSYEYTIVTALFLSKGHHYIGWAAYYPENVEEISIDLIGDEDLHIYATNYGTGWKTQQHEFFTTYDGYYTIYARQNISSSYSWGVSNIKIYRLYDLTRWVAIVRDTATNYAYNFVDDMSSPDFLDKIGIYSSDVLIPSEYWWWWGSDLSCLSNDSATVKVGTRSLKVVYPASSDIDTLRLIEADHFGKDLLWSMLDAFHFYLYVDNIDNLDTTFGKIVLGSVDSTSSDFYYSWDIATIPLETGWNDINLNFYNYSSVYPTSKGINGGFLDTILCFKINERNITSLYIQYRGRGSEVTLFFDDFRIRRNTFDTSVMYSKGLCLTYNDYLMMPLSNINLDKGSIEFHVKMGVDSLGRDSFGELHAATLFTLSSNSNDIVSLRIKPGNWFEVFAGNIRNQSLFNTTELLARTFVGIGSIVHIGLVWSNDGSGTVDGYTVKLFINGVLTLNSISGWKVSDTKLSFFKLGGGISQTSQVHANHSAFIFENVKVYNYCKDSFLIYTQDIGGEHLYTPENFIEISNDNINFVSAGSENLPMIFEQVPSQESKTIYIRTNKIKKLKSTGSNAQITVDWLTTV